MKQILLSFFLISLFLLIVLLTILSTIGVETTKFNQIISEKIHQNNKHINLKFETIKFKIDIKNISLFLETNDPNINYRGAKIPTQNIKVYVNFLSIFGSEPKIEKINFILEQVNFEEFKKISLSFKPSNLKSFINNKIKKGFLNSEIEIYFNDKNILKNFIARGTVSNLETEIINNINFGTSNFNFFADRSDILITNFSSNEKFLKIEEGDLKIKLNPELSIESNFTAKLNYKNFSKSFKDLFEKYEFKNTISELKADLNNNLFISFDKTYKLKEYELSSKGQIITASMDFKNPIENDFFRDKINRISLKSAQIDSNINTKKKKFNISGKYSVNQGKDLSLKLVSIFEDKINTLKLDADYFNPVEIELINFKDLDRQNTTVTLDLTSKNEKIEINELKLLSEKDTIILKGLNYENDKIKNFKEIAVKTINNDFKVLFGKKIKVSGSKFDASNLPKIFNRESKKNIFSNINKEIEISLENVIAPLSEKIVNFNLIGKIEDGKFSKISSKGDFGNNNFLDISMKNDRKNNKKYLEIYSDITKPLLTEFTFFKGLIGGKLLYSSIIENNISNSKLKIENFKVVNAPGMIKLLSLADLGGLADLAKGEGISFDILEINMEKRGDVMNINEILALGPSVSVLMDGYSDKSVTSLRGTLVPAKTFNKVISKIPVIGDIIIPKEVGEGLFGVSFKMKGPPGKIKTTINPIKTLTPRFIQKILDKNREVK